MMNFKDFINNLTSEEKQVVIDDSVLYWGNYLTYLDGEVDRLKSNVNARNIDELQEFLKEREMISQRINLLEMGVIKKESISPRCWNNQFDGVVY